MGNIIYYFSGRGNSLSVAKGLAERLEGAETVQMASLEGVISLNEGSVGLVLPVIDLGVPGFVRRFVKRLRAAGEAPYMYAVVTCGGMPGATLQALGNLLKHQELKLSAGWTMAFGLERMTDDEWHGRLDAAAGVIRQRVGAPIPAPSFTGRLLTGLANPLARLMIPAEDKKFRVAEGCNGCGVCARVCPVGNIEIKGDKPVWLHRCEQCAACFSWCPKEAISGSCLAARTHYTNPDTKLEQILLKR